MSSQVYIIGIAGGTGSGKTSFANLICENFNSSDVVIIQQDSYYKNLSKLSIEERSRVNFDHPSSLDFDLMKNQLSNLIKGSSIKVPEYDYSTHTRTKNNILIENPKIIILEGILVLYDTMIRNLLNLKIFIDVPDDIRIIRRIKRDMNKRMRSLSSITEQYYKTVRPMHNQFVKETKQYADLIVPKGKNNIVSLEIIKTKIMSIL